MTFAALLVTQKRDKHKVFKVSSSKNALNPQMDSMRFLFYFFSIP